jgi:hypothetical protein
MRTRLPIALPIAIYALAMGVPAAPAAAGGVIQEGTRYNYVYRVWGPRSTYRFHQFREHNRLELPRYYYRTRREGWDIRIDRAPPAPVVEHREPMK